MKHRRAVLVGKSQVLDVRGPLPLGDNDVAVRDGDREPVDVVEVVRVPGLLRVAVPHPSQLAGDPPAGDPFESLQAWMGVPSGERRFAILG